MPAVNIAGVGRVNFPPTMSLDEIEAASQNLASGVGRYSSGVRPDLADLQTEPGSPGTDSSQWDTRADGSPKGNGWLGLLRRPDGNVSSELSVGVEIDGKEQEIPLLVPTLTRDEVNQVLTSKSPPRAALNKAVDFARGRIAAGQNPFASPDESPKFRQFNPDLANLDRMMTGTAPGAPASEAPEHLTLPFLNVDVPLTGMAKDAYTGASSFVDENATPAVLGATVGSLAVPPLAIGEGLPLLARLAAQYGPSVVGAGVGGGLGGAFEAAQQPNATPSSITSAGLRSAGDMAMAEAAGAGAGAVVSRVLAPNLKFLDPLSSVRADLVSAARAVPDQLRSGVSRVIEAIPEGPVKDAAEGAARTIGKVNSTVRQMLTPEASAVPVRDVVNNVADALGLQAEHGPELLDVAARNPSAVAALQTRLSPTQLDDFRSAVLGRTIAQSTVKTKAGYLVLDGGRFRAAFAPVRGVFSPAQRYTADVFGVLGSSLQRIGRFASNPTVRKVADRASVLGVDAAFGLHVGLPFAVAKALLRPTALQHYLTRQHGIPTEMAPLIGAQLARLPFRTHFASEQP